MSPKTYQRIIEPTVVYSTSGPIPESEDDEELPRLIDDTPENGPIPDLDLEHERWIDFWNHTPPSEYTERIQRELNDHRLTGSREYQSTSEYANLLYQSGVCLLVDNVRTQTYCCRRESDYINTEDATNYLHELNLCLCCEDHINQREIEVCRSVDGCECECSRLYDEILDCQSRDRDR